MDAVSSASTAPRPTPGGARGPDLDPLSGAQSVARVAWQRDEQFLGMLRAFRRHGGLARLTEGLRRRVAACVRTADPAWPLRFDWGGSTWLPWFQFDGDSFEPRDDVRRIAAELGHVFDGWQLALWFAEPNAWLGGEAPVDRLEADANAVHAAARADRYVALG